MTIKISNEFLLRKKSDFGPFENGAPDIATNLLTMRFYSDATGHVAAFDAGAFIEILQ